VAVVQSRIFRCGAVPKIRGLTTPRATSLARRHQVASFRIVAKSDMTGSGR